MAGKVGYSSLLSRRGATRLGCVRTVLIVVFDGVQSLDLTGPLEAFEHASAVRPDAYRITTASLGGRPVRTSSRLLITPDADLRDLAEPPHTLLVPGGPGARRRTPNWSPGCASTPPQALRRPPAPAATPTPRRCAAPSSARSASARPNTAAVSARKPHQMAGAPLTDWLIEADKTSTWTTTVCTGALILARTGLLNGRQATTHWLAMDELARLGVSPRRERYVFDGKYATAAGVSAGIDMALALVARIAGDEEAKRIQLAIEYDPRPPFNSGSPASAPSDLVAAFRATSRFAHSGA
jgi:transcriptional regulator GlxA family with amidase domain